MATMYTANHLDIKAIIALTESGTTVIDVQSQFQHPYLGGLPIRCHAQAHDPVSRRLPYPFDATHTIAAL